MNAHGLSVRAGFVSPSWNPAGWMIWLRPSFHLRKRRCWQSIHLNTLSQVLRLASGWLARRASSHKVTNLSANGAKAMKNADIQHFTFFVQSRVRVRLRRPSLNTPCAALDRGHHRRCISRPLGRRIRIKYRCRFSRPSKNRVTATKRCRSCPKRNVGICAGRRRGAQRQNRSSTGSRESANSYQLELGPVCPPASKSACIGRASGLKRSVVSPSGGLLPVICWYEANARAGNNTHSCSLRQTEYGFDVRQRRSKTSLAG